MRANQAETNAKLAFYLIFTLYLFVFNLILILCIIT
jgi:hypothetical protein